MKTWRFKGLFDTQTWIEPAFVSVNAEGRVTAISDSAPDHAADQEESVAGWAIPGIPNAHSHAFQYAMAGLTEHLPPGRARDDFWSWRETMYDLALRITPEQLEKIATMLYAEMLRMGFTSVAEFHYLHHAPDGTPYANIVEMGQRLAAAAERAGIAITLIPVFYHRGDFDQPPTPRQRRFVCTDLDGYLNLLEKTRAAINAVPDGALGFGVHSLRAASPSDIRRLFDDGPAKDPFHIHVAEQKREVEACRASCKATPVEWLLNNTPLDGRCHLVHATHATEEEIKGIAARSANVVLCPSTEGNLGDGFFPLPFLGEIGGNWSIGTDSHVGLNPFEELRWLDYGRRLSDQRRNSICGKPGDDSGNAALTQAIGTGYKALGKSQTPCFASGTAFDALILDERFPLFRACPTERLLSTLVYASDPSALLGTLRRGKWVIKEGLHKEGEILARDFETALKELRTT